MVGANCALTQLKKYRWPIQITPATMWIQRSSDCVTSSMLLLPSVPHRLPSDVRSASGAAPDTARKLPLLRGRSSRLSRQRRRHGLRGRARVRIEPGDGGGGGEGQRDGCREGGFVAPAAVAHGAGEGNRQRL